jgi:hypothetical protein
MVFNTIFNNISFISWRSVLLVAETEVPRVNHQPAASHWHTLLFSVLFVHSFWTYIKTLLVYVYVTLNPSYTWASRPLLVYVTLNPSYTWTSRPLLVYVTLNPSYTWASRPLLVYVTLNPSYTWARRPLLVYVTLNPSYTWASRPLFYYLDTFSFEL